MRSQWLQSTRRLPRSATHRRRSGRTTYLEGEPLRLSELAAHSVGSGCQASLQHMRGARQQVHGRHPSSKTPCPWNRAEARERLDWAKSTVGISRAWEVLGLEGRPNRSCRSPFREDRKPSFSISSDDLLWHDFGTGEGGDVVSFVQKATGNRPVDAIRLVESIANGGPTHGLKEITRRSKPLTEATSDRPVDLELLDPTVSDLAAIAEVRDWPSFAGLELARARGMLWVANVSHSGDRHRAFILTDASLRSAQARRLDGQPWASSGGGFKSKSLRSDDRAPAGLFDITSNDRQVVLICEGEPDSLAAFLLAWSNPALELARFGVLCLAGAGKQLSEEVVYQLRGRHCRIFRHADDAGHRAALSWGESLKRAQVRVDIVNLDGRRDGRAGPGKDLADLCRRPLEIGELEVLSTELLQGISC